MNNLTNKLKEEYPVHLDCLQKRTKKAMSRENIEGVVIHSGQEIKAFLDDLSLIHI